MDPLKPFGTIIRSIWSRTTRRTERNEKSVDESVVADSRANRTSEVPSANPLRSRLQVRMSRIGDWNSSLARETFVETILISELGDNLVMDPAFADLVRKVSAQLSSDPKLSARLDDLLKDLYQTPAQSTPV